MLGRVHIIFSSLFVAIVLGLLATIPVWPYSRAWGYYPSGGVLVVGVLLIVVMATGKARDAGR